MSKIINSGLDQYGAKTFEQRYPGTAGVEGVNEKLGKNKNQQRNLWKSRELCNST